MIKRLVVVTAVVASAAVAGGAGAASAGTGCSAQDTLTTIQGAFDTLDLSRRDPSEYPAILAGLASTDTDKNQDGLLCVKQFKPTKDGFTPTMINDNRLGGKG
jgi:hypothetical protein